MEQRKCKSLRFISSCHRSQVSYLEEQLRTMQPDLDSIEAYCAKERDFNEKQADLKKATQERDEVRGGAERPHAISTLAPH